MAWRDTQSVRRQYLNYYDEEKATRYDSEPGHGMSADEEAALLDDLGEVLDLDREQQVLDVGAGTGVLTKLLAGKMSLSISALKPSPAMLAKLRGKLSHVEAKQGFTDSPEDVKHFQAGSFDLIISRQVVCGLCDPLQAFTNWSTWLRRPGTVVVVDTLCSRESWSCESSDVADVLPLSCVLTPALTPYLLEKSGFDIRFVQWLKRTNHYTLEQVRVGKRTSVAMRYVVVADKIA